MNIDEFYRVMCTSRIDPGLKMPRRPSPYGDVFMACCDIIDEGDGRQGIETAFRNIDDNGTGKISFKKLKRIAQELGEPGCRAMGLD